MVEQLNAAQIGAVLEGLVESEFDIDYDNESNTAWQDALYDAWNDNQENLDVIRAALMYLSGHVAKPETVWTPKQFRRLMDNYYKAKYATKGQFARQHSSDIGNHDVETIEEFSDFIDWNRYADVNLSGDYAFIQLEEDGEVYVFEDDFEH